MIYLLPVKKEETFLLKRIARIVVNVSINTTVYGWRFEPVTNNSSRLSRHSEAVASELQENIEQICPR